MPAALLRRARPITTLLSAATLALAGLGASAAPARASDDLTKFILGATTLYVISRAISNNNNRGPQVIAPQRPGYPPHHGWQQGPGRGGHHRALVLPASCAVTIPGQRGRSFYGATCLQRAGLGRMLPDRCERELRADRGRRTIYDGACLQNAGFRPETRRR